MKDESQKTNESELRSKKIQKIIKIKKKDLIEANKTEVFTK